MNKVKRPHGSTIQILVSEKEREAVRKAAREHGMTISSYCRWVLIYNKEGNNHD